MSHRKISECINVRINVGNYQHIELTKYAEEAIDYSSDKERIAKEDQLRDDLMANLIRSMKAIPEKLGKGIEEAIEVEEAIKKAIPEWLENGPVPNIANTAEKKHIQNVSEQKSKKDKAEADAEEILNTDNNSEVPKNDDEGDAEDLFEEDEMPEPEKVEVTDTLEELDENEAKKETENKDVKAEKKPVKDGEEGLDGFFDGEDDDLFGDI
jgi:hypothetical protein